MCTVDVAHIPPKRDIFGGCDAPDMARTARDSLAFFLARGLTTATGPRRQYLLEPYLNWDRVYLWGRFGSNLQLSLVVNPTLVFVAS